MAALRSYRRTLTVIAALATLALVVRWAWPSRVRLAPAVRGPAAEVVYATGAIDFENRIQLRARSGGTVVKLLVKEGEIVRAGQPLAALESPQLTATQRRLESQLKVARSRARRAGARDGAASSSRVQAIRAELGQAKREAEAVGELVQTGALPAVERERAQTRVDVLSSDLHASLSSHRAHRSDSLETVVQLEADLLAAEAAVQDLEIKAPFDGVVLGALLQRGDVIAAAQPAFVVAQAGELVATLSVDETAVGRLRPRDGATPGSSATVRIYAEDRRPYAGEVIEVAPEADRDRRTFRVKVRLPGAHPELRSGMTAEADILVREHPNAVLVPTEAIDKDAVWTIDRGRAYRRPVVFGIRDLKHTEVLSGLAAGEAVVLHADAPLTAGRWVLER